MKSKSGFPLQLYGRIFSKVTNRLIIGTAQFGLNYGVANKTGRINISQARVILEKARRHKITCIDTAIGYGLSEKTLGSIGVGDWQIITKLPAIPSECRDIYCWVQNQIKFALQRLGVQRLYGLLLHRPDELLDSRGDELYSALLRVRDGGVVERIGVSIYHPIELDKLFDRMSFDLVQSPYNIFDRRIVTTGWAARLDKLGVELHVRSIFLQGLLLMPPASRPSYFSPWTSLMHEWDNWVISSNVSRLKACLSFSLHTIGSAKVVVGVDSAQQLQEIISVAESPLRPIPLRLQSVDENLLNPSLWRLS